MIKHYRNKIIQGIALAFAIFILLIVLADGRELVDNLRDFPLLLLIPLVLLKLVNWACRYAEWHVLLGFVDVQVKRGQDSAPPSAPDQPATLRLRDSIVIYMTGLPMAMSPGKVAELLKSAIVKNLTGTPISRTAPVVMTERIVDGIAVLLLIGMAVLYGQENVIKEVEGVSSSTIQGIVLGTIAAMIIGVGAFQIKPLAHWVLNLLKHIPLLNRLQPWLAEFYASSYELLMLKRLLPVVSFGLIGYGTDCIALYMMLRGMGVEGGMIMLAQATFILGFAVIVAALSAMPGGAGARELSVSVLIAGIVGANEGVAQSVTAINSFFQVGLQVLVGIFIAVIYRQILFPPTLEAALQPEDEITLELEFQTKH